jgi:predicted nucleic acid-binding Zn ribbon protein
MIYGWRCLECGDAVEVERKLSDYKLPPQGEEAEHDGCDVRDDFRRILTLPKRIYVIPNFNPETGRE